MKAKQSTHRLSCFFREVVFSLDWVDVWMVRLTTHWTDSPAATRTQNVSFPNFRVFVPKFQYKNWTNRLRWLLPQRCELVLPQDFFCFPPLFFLFQLLLHLPIWHGLSLLLHPLKTRPEWFLRTCHPGSDLNPSFYLLLASATSPNRNSLPLEESHPLYQQQQTVPIFQICKSKFSCQKSTLTCQHNATSCLPRQKHQLEHFKILFYKWVETTSGNKARERERWWEEFFFAGNSWDIYRGHGPVDRRCRTERWGTRRVASLLPWLHRCRGRWRCGWRWRRVSLAPTEPPATSRSCGEGQLADFSRNGIFLCTYTKNVFGFMHCNYFLHATFLNICKTSWKRKARNQTFCKRKPSFCSVFLGLNKYLKFPGQIICLEV